MKLTDFIGQIVIEPTTKKRYMLYEITAPCIVVVTEKPDARGYHTRYSWKTINGDPISNGILLFENATLTEPFKVAYNEDCHGNDAYWEEYGYWMRRD